MSLLFWGARCECQEPCQPRRPQHALFPRTDSWAALAKISPSKTQTFIFNFYNQNQPQPDEYIGRYPRNGVVVHVRALGYGDVCRTQCAGLLPQRVNVWQIGTVALIEICAMSYITASSTAKKAALSCLHQALFIVFLARVEEN